MTNPWAIIGARHVHPDDEYYVNLHNRTAKPPVQIQRSLPALPFIGNLETARVIILGKNASFSEVDDEDAERIPALIDENLKALTFESDYPFFYLDPRFADTNGYRWWSKALDELIAACVEKGVDAQTVASRIACAQAHPYRSRTAFMPKELFPTQSFTFENVRLACGKDTLFVLQYGATNERLWREKIAPLPSDCVRLKSVQTPDLTRRNMSPEDFDRLVAALCA